LYDNVKYGGALYAAKREETRAKRLVETLAELERDRTAGRGTASGSDD